MLALSHFPSELSGFAKVAGFVRASGGDAFSQQIEKLSVGEAIIRRLIWNPRSTYACVV